MKASHVTAFGNAAARADIDNESLDINIPVDRNDEIGVLAKTFQRMMLTIRGNYHQIHKLAYTDSVSGLANREQFRESMAEAIRCAGNWTGYVIFIDLDRFKWVNDSYGHDRGDELLRMTAERLQNCIDVFCRKLEQEKDPDRVYVSNTLVPLLARVGGDEFSVLVQPGLTRSKVSELVRLMLAELEDAFQISEHSVRIGASIGIAPYRWDSSYERALKHSDLAMYEAKQGGGQAFCFFTEELEQRRSGTLALESDLKRALENNEFKVYYQPKVDCRTGQPQGVEALVRWNHPEKGILLPGDFIGFAEDLGLIVEIGRRVLAEACLQAVRWQQQGRNISVAVNLSALQLESPVLSDHVDEALIGSGLEPSMLELEITESMMMSDQARVIKIIKQLRDKGIRFAIDDFGTGYSSLSYLTRLPVDTLKIDRTFISQMTEDDNSRIVVETILAMAASLNMQTIAEGVENLDHVEFLAVNGCSMAQGFHFARPMPAQICSEWFERHCQPNVVDLQKRVAEEF